MQFHALNKMKNIIVLSTSKRIWTQENAGSKPVLNTLENNYMYYITSDMISCLTDCAFTGIRENRA